MFSVDGLKEKFCILTETLDSLGVGEVFGIGGVVVVFMDVDTFVAELVALGRDAAEV
jgi:hypothetical protein